MPNHPMSAPEPYENFPLEPAVPAEKFPPQNVPLENAAGNAARNLPTSPVPRVLRPQPDDACFETDFADLAARFSAKSGGGLSPELSADLALEIVLNEIVEQACLATGATGAAIVLRRDGDLVCRATSGPTAPELGATMDSAAGLSGLCVQTLVTQRCNDVIEDARADVDGAARLGVRSAIVMPLLRGPELLGVFELFSARPYAFGDRDERTLEALASRTLSNLDRAGTSPDADRAWPTRNAELQAEASEAEVTAGAAREAEVSGGAFSGLVREDAVSQTAGEHATDALSKGVENLRPENHGAETAADRADFRDDNEAPAGTDYTTFALRVAILLCTLMLGLVVGRHFTLHKTATRTHAAPVAVAAAGDTNPAAPAPGKTAGLTSDPAPEPAPAPSPLTVTQSPVHEKLAVPPGGMRVFDNGKEIFRMNPAAVPPENGVVQPAAAIEHEHVMQLSPSVAEGSLLKRVEPQYPEAARTQKIQGPVVLDVRIGTSGVVENVEVLSGAPLLAQASTDAVRRWLFKPHRSHGQPAEMETRVTLNFRLPQ